MTIKTKIEDNGEVVFKFTYDEATILAIKLSKSFEQMLNNTHKVSYDV